LKRVGGFGEVTAYRKKYRCFVDWPLENYRLKGPGDVRVSSYSCTKRNQEEYIYQHPSRWGTNDPSSSGRGGRYIQQSLCTRTRDIGKSCKH
jgi:hypothetical protein